MNSSDRDVEDGREAVRINVTLSTQLISAALVAITVEGALLVLALDGSESNHLYLCLAMLAFASFLVSIFCGARGVTRLAAEGKHGNWNPSVAAIQFNWQAMFCISGIALFIAMVGVIAAA